MTLKQLKELKTFKVLKQFTGKFHADNHEELKAHIIEMLVMSGIDPETLEETESHFAHGNRLWFKPKIKKETTGTVTIRSKDYVFTSDITGTKSYGTEIKAADTLANGFKCKTYDGNEIIYTILGE